jgi:hypothetical protein
MAEKSKSFASLLAALVVAVTGLIPVAWLLTAPQAESVVEGEVAVELSTTTSTPPATTVVVASVPELDVQELDPSILRVLQANGYAELAPESEVAADLPPSVTRVLIDNGAVLTVVEEDPNPGEG